MAKLARFFGLPAISSGVEELAGESLVEVETLVPLGAPVSEVELAQLPHLRRLRVVRVHALLRRLLALALHEHVAQLLLPALSVFSPLPLPLVSFFSLPFPLLPLPPAAGGRHTAGAGS